MTSLGTGIIGSGYFGTQQQGVQLPNVASRPQRHAVSSLVREQQSSRVTPGPVLKKVKGDNDGFVGYHHMSIEYSASPSPQSPVLPSPPMLQAEIPEQQKVNRYQIDHDLYHEFPSQSRSSFDLEEKKEFQKDSYFQTTLHSSFFVKKGQASPRNYKVLQITNQKLNSPPPPR